MARLALAVLLLSCATAVAAPRRIAVVVGANGAAPGRQALRYAHNDADRVAEVLELAGFAERDVQILHDPEPHILLSAIDRAVRSLRRSPGETLLLFYYSGHADGGSLYPGGERLAMADVRARLERGAATVRMGIIDACRGGSWTGAKGLSEAAPFEIPMPLRLANEGSVLISSSSGVESAHESEALQGSYFTHHWNAALRGAGDRDGDGTVTLGEAFDYARRFTIRDTARQVGLPQHPSFQLNLRGKDDLPLVALTAATGVLSIDRSLGPLQLIELESGIVLLEIIPGPTRARLAVPPGRYLVRRPTARGVLTAEVEVRSGATIHVDRARLTADSPDLLANKGDLPWERPTEMPWVKPAVRVATSAAPPRAPGWSKLAIATAGLDLGGRWFRYHGPDQANYPSVDLSAVPFVRVGLAGYLRDRGRGAMFRGIGITGQFGWGKSVTAASYSGVTTRTRWSEHELGLRGQFLPDDLVAVGLRAGIGGTSFTFTGGDVAPDEFPSARYRYSRFGSDLRVALAPRWALTSAFDLRFVSKTGPIEENVADASAIGIGLEGGVAYELRDDLELRGELRYLRFKHTLTPYEDSYPFRIESATDVLYGFGATLAYRL